VFKKQGSAGSMDLVQCVKAADSLIEFFQRLEKWLGAFAATHTLSEKRELPGPPLAESLAKEVLGTLTRVGVVFHTKNGRICMKPVGGSAGPLGLLFILIIVLIRSFYCVQVSERPAVSTLRTKVQSNPACNTHCSEDSLFVLLVQATLAVFVESSSAHV